MMCCIEKMQYVSCTYVPEHTYIYILSVFDMYVYVSMCMYENASAKLNSEIHTYTHKTYIHSIPKYMHLYVLTCLCLYLHLLRICTYVYVNDCIMHVYVGICMNLHVCTCIAMCVHVFNFTCTYLKQKNKGKSSLKPGLGVLQRAINIAR